MLNKYDDQTNHIRETISTLLRNILEADKLSLEAFTNDKVELYKEAEDKLNNIKVQGDIIDNDIIKTFALYGPEANELRTLVAYLKMTNEIIRIGSGVKKYASRMKSFSQTDCDISSMKTTIIQLHKSTINALEYITNCFSDLEACDVRSFYAKVMVEESKNDDFFAVLEKEIMHIIIDEKELSTEYVKILGALRKLERSCDRSINIANLIIYAKEGGSMNIHS